MRIGLHWFLAAIYGVQKQINSNIRENTKLLKKVSIQINKTEVNRTDEDERTVLIRKYKDKEIRNNMNIRKCINEHYKGVVIRNARTTAGGSILIEFDDKETADTVKATWDKDLFGGNAGAYKANERNPTGIIKHVYHEKSEKEFEQEIQQVYPEAKCELFMKEDRFMGNN